MKPSRFLLICGLLLPTAIFAQNNSSKLPQKGNTMIELNMTPFHQEKVFTFDRLQAKYWLNESVTLRLGLEVDHRKDGADDSGYLKEEANNSTFSEKTTLFGIHPGIEYRILKGTKISPYLGLEFSYRNRSASSEYSTYKSYFEPHYIITTEKISNGWHSYEVSGGYLYTYNLYPERAFTSFGANLILGTDLFLMKNIYFGFEGGLGYRSIHYRRIELDQTVFNSQNGSLTTSPKSTLQPASKPSNLSFYSNGAIRLGIWF